MPKPPFFRQTYPFSCVPACVRMVLASLNYEISEPELRSLCECDETGTSPSKAVKAVIACGFISYQANLTFEELSAIVAEKITPIVFIRAFNEVAYSHAIVIYKISSTEIFVIDPEIGEYTININKFGEIWSGGLTIVIEEVK